MLSDFSCPAYPGAVPGAPGNITSESRLDPQGGCGFLSSRLLGPSQRNVRFPERMDTYANSSQKYSKKGKINPPQKKECRFKEIERGDKRGGW